MLYEIEDKFISLVAIALLVGFFGIIAWFVKELDLILVLGLAVGLAIYDFYFHGRWRSST
jgi:hypothetical protein